MKKRILAPLALLLMPLIAVSENAMSAAEAEVIESVVSVDGEAKVTAETPAAAEAVIVTESVSQTVSAPEEIAAVATVAANDAEGLNPDLVPVYKLPAWVERVEAFCPWKSNDGEGYVRVVRTERHGRHQLFLQWIKKGGTAGSDKVLSTRSVEELEKDYIVRLEMPKAMLNPKSCELTTMADSLNNSQRFRFKVVLREPGNYMLQVTRVLGTAEI